MKRRDRHFRSMVVPSLVNGVEVVERFYRGWSWAKSNATAAQHYTNLADCAHIREIFHFLWEDGTTNLKT